MTRLICLVFSILIYSACTDNKAKLKQLLDKALQYESNGKIEEAIKTYKEILEINNNDYAAANSIAGLYGVNKQYDKEIQWAHKSIVINPEWYLAYINLGSAYLALNNIDSAKYYYRMATGLQPGKPEPLYSLGVIEESLGDYNAAAAYYERCVHADTTFWNGYFNLAAAYANLGAWSKADIAISRYITNNPSDDEALQMQQDIRSRITN